MVRVLTPEGNLVLANDAVEDEVNQRGFAAALFAIEQVTAAMKETVLMKALAQAPEMVHLGQDASRQAVGKVNEVVEL